MTIRWRNLLQPWWPPLRRREFWVVQAMVVGIAVGHGLNEWTEVVDLTGAEFLPVSLYLLPVVYASLSFGMRGAAPTAVWSFLLTLPNIALWHAEAGAIGELWQTSLVLVVGLFIGQRVDREREARRQAERRERERRASEDRYRGLFDAAADAILLLDQQGRIQEANAAASTLLDRSPEELCGEPVAGLSRDLSDAVRLDAAGPTAPIAIERSSGTRWLQTITVPFRDADGQPRLLVLLHDVTDARERQHLLETFARGTVAAREEERRRVARELHDGPLQSLMLLWRSLDALGSPPNREGSRILAEARERAEGAADELRRFSRDLRPSILDDLGLAPALRAEAAALTERSGIQTSFQSTGTTKARLPAEIELTLLRICQEALRNVERHSGAQHAQVQLDLGPDHYRLAVSDDGVGIDAFPAPTARVAAGRLGVVGMQERARLVGASCTVRPSHPGTVVEAAGSTAEAN